AGDPAGLRWRRRLPSGSIAWQSPGRSPRRRRSRARGARRDRRGRPSWACACKANSPSRVSDSLVALAWVALGLGVGAYGTLIGAGGGFILVPALLFAYPRLSATQVTAISLAVVFANAVSGSVSYARQRRIDYLSAIVLAIATLPGAVIGAIVVGYIPRRLFDVIMGASLILVSVFLLVRPQGSRSLWLTSAFTVNRTLTDAKRATYEYRFNLGAAALFSVAIGFLSSLLGIGGGIIQVPLLTSLFGFPAHVATA